MPSRVALIHIEPDASLADGIADAFMRRQLPIELHRFEIEDVASVASGYYDVTILAITHEARSYPRNDAIQELRDRFQSKEMVLVTDHSLDKLTRLTGILMISLDNWRGNERDPRIDMIVDSIYRSSRETVLTTSYWERDGLTEDRSGRLLDHLMIPVDKLELSVRTSVIFKNENIAYVGDVVQRTEAEWLRTPNFGRKSLNEIKEVLSSLDLWLGMDMPMWPPPDIEREIARTAAARRVRSMSQERLGLTFEPSSEFLLVNASADQSDHEASERPVVRQLHGEIIRKTRRFASVAPRLDNNLDGMALVLYVSA